MDNINNSVFEIETNEADTGNGEQISSYYEHLVGEGKKFKDNEALAKAKIEADKTVKEREKELAEIRKELNTRISIEEFMTKNFQRTPNSQEPSTDGDEPREPSLPNEGNKPIDVEKVVDEVFTRKQLQAQKAQNAAKAKQLMKEVWGSNASERLNSVSEELGLGKEFLQDLAERSPEAFAQVVGLKDVQKTVVNQTPPTSNVNSFAMARANPNVRNEQYWDEVKKRDPKFYFSIDGYNQRHKDALALGADYFK